MRGPDLTEAEGFAESFVRRLQTQRELLGVECRILGPAPPPLYKLRGKYRFHAILQSKDAAMLNRLIVRATADVKPPKDVQFMIDIDPMDTL